MSSVVVSGQTVGGAAAAIEVVIAAYSEGELNPAVSCSSGVEAPATVGVSECRSH